MTTGQRILKSVEPNPNGCWIWKRQLYRNGYGRIQFGGQNKRIYMLAHRVSYDTFIGPIGDGLVLDHLCRNKACVNPQHLEPVSQKTNLNRGKDMIWMVRRKQTHCKHGHSLDDAIPEWKEGKIIGRKCRVCNYEYKKAYRERQKA